MLLCFDILRTNAVLQEFVVGLRDEEVTRENDNSIIGREMEDAGSRVTRFWDWDVER